MEFPISRAGKALIVLAGLCIPLFLPIGDAVVSLLFWSVVGMPVAIFLVAVPLIVFCGGAGWASSALAKSLGMPSTGAFCLGLLIGVAPLTLPVLVLNPTIERDLARVLEKDVAWPKTLPEADHLALAHQRTEATRVGDARCDALCTELLVYAHVPDLIVARLPALFDLSDTTPATRFQLRASSACADLRDVAQLAPQDPKDLRHTFRFCIEAIPTTLAEADLVLVEGKKTSKTPNSGLAERDAPGISSIQRRSVLQRKASGLQIVGQQSWVSYRTFARLPYGVDLQSTSDGSFSVHARLPTMQHTYAPSKLEQDWIRAMLGLGPS